MDQSEQTGEHDVGGIPLPRRGPSAGRIARAHEELFGRRDVASSGEEHRGWGDVDRRERSAALARAVVTRGRVESAGDVRPGEDIRSAGAGWTTEDTPTVEDKQADESAPGTEDAPPADDAPATESTTLGGVPRDSALAGPSSGSATGTEAPGKMTTSSDASVPRSRPRLRDRWLRDVGLRPLAATATVLLLVLFAGIALGSVFAALGQPVAAPAAAPVVAGPPPPLPSRPTLQGDVLVVHDGGSLAVQVADRTLEVSVLGLDAPRRAPGVPTPCGADAATAFTANALAGQRVTLVPDLVGPEFDANGRRWAYVVLETQQNFTDLALLEGIGRRDTTRAFTYGPVFAREEATARAASAGIWGAPCYSTP